MHKKRRHNGGKPEYRKFKYKPQRTSCRCLADNVVSYVVAVFARAEQCGSALIKHSFRFKYAPTVQLTTFLPARSSRSLNFLINCKRDAAPFQNGRFV